MLRQSHWFLILDKLINEWTWWLSYCRTKTVACSLQHFGSCKSFGQVSLYFTQHTESGLLFECIIPLSVWLWGDCVSFHHRRFKQKSLDLMLEKLVLIFNFHCQIWILWFISFLILSLIYFTVLGLKFQDKATFISLSFQQFAKISRTAGKNHKNIFYFTGTGTSGW